MHDPDEYIKTDHLEALQSQSQHAFMHQTCNIYVPAACTGRYLSNAANMHMVTNDLIAKTGMQTTSPDHTWT